MLLSCSVSRFQLGLLLISWSSIRFDWCWLHHMETHSISSLTPGRPAKPLKIRVIRKWTIKARANEIWYLLVDKNGDAIQAVAGKNDKSYIDARLALASCYELNGYVCAPTKSTPQVVKHQTTLKIGQATQILSLDEDNNIPHFYFQFRQYANLRAIANDTNSQTDYIGIVENTHEGITTLNDPYLKILLINESRDAISLAVWKETLQTMDEATLQTLKNLDKPLVLAVTSADVNTFRDYLQIKTSNTSSIYLNPPIPETESLLNSYNSQKITGSSSVIQHLPRSSKMPLQTTLDSLLQKPRQEIAENTYSCCASIIAYNEASGWYYAACPLCEFIIDELITDEGEQKWACPTHGNTNKPKFMFRISAIIADHTGTAPVTIFDKPAKQLLKKDAFDLVIKENYREPNVIPAPLLAARSQPKTFTLTAPSTAHLRRLIFTVQQVSDEPPSQHEQSSVLAIDAPANTTQTPPAGYSTPKTVINPAIKRNLYLERNQQEESGSSKRPCLSDPAE